MAGQRLSRRILQGWLALAVFGGSVAVAATDEGSSRRDQRRMGEKIESPVKSRQAEAPENPNAGYQITDRQKLLYRRAIRMFYDGNFALSLESFAFAYKEEPDHAELMMDYALCSLLYPFEQRSSQRALELIDRVDGMSEGKNGKNLLLRGIYLTEIQQVDAARRIFIEARALVGAPLADHLIRRLNLGLKPLVDHELQMQIMPMLRIVQQERPQDSSN